MFKTKCGNVRRVKIACTKLQANVTTQGSKGTLIADRGCDTTVYGGGFKAIATINRKASLVSFVDDKVKNNVSIGTAVTVVDLPNGKMKVSY